MPRNPYMDVRSIVVKVKACATDMTQCKGQHQCDLKCSRCVDDETRNDGKGKCKLLYPFKFDENCHHLRKCVDDCNNRGRCLSQDERFAPWCDCDDFYYGVGCRNKSNADNEEDVYTAFSTKQHYLLSELPAHSPTSFTIYKNNTTSS
ncbi:hypothetical protein J6590_041441 [Homalodisca vitripennis]|nr:hypothetical protein J6590_041441 [Homalodisca vitripennis]